MQGYIDWVLRYRFLVLIATLAVSAYLLPHINNLQIAIDPQTMLPQSHPNVIATNRVADVFGSRHIVIVGVTPRAGDIFQRHVLEKVDRITSALLNAPGVIKENILSLSANKAKDIRGKDDVLEVNRLMEGVPATRADFDRLRAALDRNPVYAGTVVSADRRTTTIIVDFEDNERGFQEMARIVNAVVQPERDATVDIRIGGFPILLSQIEVYSQRALYLLMITAFIIALIHLEAFRTVQGLVLPLLTAFLATAWDLGIMGLAGIPFDVVTVTIPIVTVAVGAGHAVQILKRYYEEYHRLRDTTTLTPAAANTLAISNAIRAVGPVMLIAGTIASLGFFSLMVFGISTVRTLGLFTGVGILCALILEMTLIPTLRSLLPPPSEGERHSERGARIWDRITDTIANWVTGKRRSVLYGLVFVFFTAAVVATSGIQVDNSVKSFFSQDFPFQHEDRFLNRNLGGTNTLYLLIEGPRDDIIKEPVVLRQIEDLQRYLETLEGVGKTISIVDFLKRMNQAINNEDDAYFRIPENRELVSQYLLLYSMASDPTDFDVYVDYNYRTVNVTAFLKNDSSVYLTNLVTNVQAYADSHLSGDLRLMIGGSAAQNAALSEVLVRDKVLNIVLIISVIFVISSLVFRSIFGGILVISPLVITVAANTGIMGLFGIKLNIPTSLSFSIIVGIGADFTIYLLYRMREQIAMGVDEMTAIRHVLNTAGKACLYVATAVAGGYSVLILSVGFYVHVWMGILLVSGMLVSVLCSLTLISALMLTIRPRFIFAPQSAGVMQSSVVSLASVCVLGFFLALPNPASAEDQSASDIMTKTFLVSRLADSSFRSTLILGSPSGQQRIREVQSATKLRDDTTDNMRMTRFVSPPDVKGTATLLVERSDRATDDIWIYLPALKKVRRLVSSNKKDSFMGSDFSYGDMIGHRVEDWTHRFLEAETMGGQPCYVIESTPVDDRIAAETGYGKRVSWVRKDNHVTVKGEFWDRSGNRLKTVEFQDLRLVDEQNGKWQPMQMFARNHQTGHTTQITIHDFKANQGLDAELFTARYMERAR